MATYIPGTTDYVSQFQPFTPDYNFLGNILQQRQSTYDSNYNALNQKYGTLLNSDLLREDSLVKRDQFFKMIDQDIKKMSGLDLSLQQNVDASHKVFDSFYQNKDIFKDMVYTKEYKRQLQIADSYKNCIDQEKCGGKYWDVGVNYLNYKADEFKKASKEQMMSMSPGEYIPQINIQEKAMKLAKDYGFFSDKGGPGKIMWSQDGKYTYIQKGGAVLQTPFHEVLRNMLGKDQAVIDMYKAQAYVNRKDYILSNKDRFGGDENLAEDDYFRSLDQYAADLQKKQQEDLDKLIGAEAKKEVLKKTIEKEGTTGDDDLGIDFAAAGLDFDFATKSYEITEEQTKVAKSIYDKGLDRNLRRARYDSMFANDLLNREMFGAATGVAALTNSQESLQADPYAKSLFDFSLEVKKMQIKADLDDRNEQRKSMYEMSKEQALMDYMTGGSMIGGAGGGAGGGSENVPTPSEFKGGSTPEKDEYGALAETQTVASNDVIGNQRQWVSGLTKNLEHTIKNSKDKNSVIVAQNFLNGWLGKAEKDSQGNVVKEGYDAASQKYYVRDPKRGSLVGLDFDQAFSIIQNVDPSRLSQIYSKGIVAKNEIRSLGEQKTFFESKGNQLERSVAVAKDLVEAAEITMSDNLSAVKSLLTIEDKDNQVVLDAMTFTENGVTKLRSKEQFNEFLRKPENADLREKLSEPGFWDGFFGRVTKGIGRGLVAAPLNFIPVVGQIANAGVLGYNVYDALFGSKEGYEILNELYDTQLEMIQNKYNENPTVNGKPLIKPLTTNPMLGVGGGTTAMGAGYTFNSVQFRSQGYQGTLGFINDFNSISDGTIHLGKEVVRADDAIAPEDEVAIAKILLNGVKNDMMTSAQMIRMKKKDFEPNNFTVKYGDVALESENVVGLHIQPSQKLIDELFKGEDGKKTLKAYPKIAEGFTMYVPKEKATNAFTQSHKYQPYDIILQHKDVDLELPNAGKVTISKQKADGSFDVTANIMGVKNGKLEQVDNWTMSTPPMSRGQAVYETFFPVLQEMERYNKEVMQTGRGRIYNTNLLNFAPDGSLILSGDPKVSQGTSLQELYQQNLERNLQTVR